MTVNHDYNTPARGETNWDAPLNENFERIERDVEIRDAEANRSNFTPHDGAKFFSTDTGRIYFGDGDQWNYFGVIPESISGGSGGSAGEIVAKPGDVADTLADAATPGSWGRNPRPVVKLVAGKVYEPTDLPWEVGPNVHLDFNGALVKPGTDGDVIHQHPGTKLIHPWIDARSTPIGGDKALVRWDTRWGDYRGQNSPDILDGTFIGNHSTLPNGLVFEDSQATGMGGGSYVRADIYHVDRGIVIEASGGSSAWVNSIDMQVKIGGFVVGIEHRAVPGGATNGHQIYFNSQPHPDRSEWLWNLGTESSRNMLIGPVWDTRYYTDETVMQVPSDVGFNNVLFDTEHFLGDWQVVDHSGLDSNGIGRLLDKTFQRNR